MRPSRKFAFLLGAAAMLAGPAFAADAPPPDGHMHGPGHRGGWLAREFHLGPDGKITRAAFDKAVAERFAALSHGAATIDAAQFAASHDAKLRARAAKDFARLDWNGNGKLTLEEFAAPLHAAFTRMDRKGTGEIVCAPPAKDAPPPGDMKGKDHGHWGHGHRRGLRARFGQVLRAHFCAENDLNHDGKVTRAEYDVAIGKHFAEAAHGGDVMTEAAFADLAAQRFHKMEAKMFARLDANHDGKLTLAEFSAPEDRLFAKLDRNKDGVVTADELKPRFHRWGHKPEAGKPDTP